VFIKTSLEYPEYKEGIGSLATTRSFLKYKPEARWDILLKILQNIQQEVSHIETSLSQIYAFHGPSVIFATR